MFSTISFHPDTLHEDDESASVLIESLLDGQVIALLVQCLQRLDEKQSEDTGGVHNALAIIENIAEFKQEICVKAGEQGKFYSGHCKSP